MHPNKYDKMYMDIALRASHESKCPRTQVGCCLLLESGMIAIGFNGHASGGPNEWDYKESGDPEVIHAELNCLGKLLEEGVSAKGATAYITLSPCLECAKLLVRAKVARVVYLEAYRKTEGIDYLAKYGVMVEKYPEDQLGIDFTIHVHRDGTITNSGTTCCV
jgi:dCMP deaminase